MSYVFNPKRRIIKTWGKRLKFLIQWPFIQFGLWLGFFHGDYGLLSGPAHRLKIGQGCSTMNTVFNTQSGNIMIGDDTIFGHNCMVITGQHRFYKGKRAKLHPDCKIKEVPSEGNDITIGSGCYICSGVIISKGVTIGDHALVGAGAVVTKDIPSNCFAAGNPARVIRYLDEENVNTFK